MQFPILSVIVFTPLVAGLLILLIPAERKTEVRMAALAAGAFALLLSIWVYFSYDVAAGRLPVHREIHLAAGAGHLLPCRCGRDERDRWCC